MRCFAPPGPCSVSSSVCTIHTTVALLEVAFTTNGPPAILSAGLSAAASAAPPASNSRISFFI